MKDCKALQERLREVGRLLQTKCPAFELVEPEKNKVVVEGRSSGKASVEAPMPFKPGFKSSNAPVKKPQNAPTKPSNAPVKKPQNVPKPPNAPTKKPQNVPKPNAPKPNAPKPHRNIVMSNNNKVVRRRPRLTRKLHASAMTPLSNRWMTDYQTRLKNRLAIAMRKNKDSQLYRRNYNVLEKVEIFA